MSIIVSAESTLFKDQSLKKFIQMNSNMKILDNSRNADISYIQTHLKTLSQPYLKQIKQNPQNWSAYKILAEIYFFAQKPARAIWILELARRANTNVECSSIIYFMIGKIYASVNDIERSCQYFKKAIQINPNQSQIYSEMAQGLFSLQKFEESTKYFQKALLINPQNYSATVGQAFIFACIGKTTQAILYFEKAIQLRPDDVKGYHMIGGFFYSNQKFELAAQAWEIAIGMDPSLHDVYYNLSNCYLHLRSIKKCIQICQRAIQKFPKDLKFYINIAHSYTFIGAYSKGIDHFQRLLKENFLEAYYGLAMTYLKMKDLKKSFMYAFKSVKFNPSLSISFCLITYLYFTAQPTQFRNQIANQMTIEAEKLLKTQSIISKEMLNFALFFKCSGLQDNSNRIFNHIFSYINEKQIWAQIHLKQQAKNIKINQFIDVFAAFVSFSHNYKLFINLEMGLFYKLIKQKTQPKLCYNQEKQLYQLYTKQSHSTKRKGIKLNYFLCWMYENKINGYTLQGKSLLSQYILSEMIKQNQYETILSIAWLINKQPQLRNPPIYGLVNSYKVKSIQSVMHMCQFITEAKLFTINSRKVIFHQKPTISQFLKRDCSSKQEILFIKSILTDFKYLKKILQFLKIHESNIIQKSEKLDGKRGKLKNLVKFHFKSNLLKLGRFKCLTIQRTLFSQKNPEPSLFNSLQKKFYQACFQAYQLKQTHEIRICNNLFHKELIKFIFNKLAHYLYLDQHHTKTLTDFLETIHLNPFYDLSTIKMKLLKMFNQYLSEASIMDFENSKKSQTKNAQSEAYDQLSSLSFHSFEFGAIQKQPAINGFRPQFIQIDQAKDNAQEQQAKVQGQLNALQGIKCKKSQLMTDYITNKGSYDLQVNKHSNQHVSSACEQTQKTEKQNIIDRQNVYYGIICIGNILIDLEQKGIFHIGVEWTNIRSYKGYFGFISNDSTFKVKLCQGEDENLELFRTTINYLQIMLRINSHQILQHLFKHLKQVEQNDQHFIDSLVQKLNNTPLVMQARVLLDQLDNHRHKSHLIQYCKVVQDFISHNLQSENVLSQKETDQISNMLQSLKNNYISFQQFIQKLKQLNDEDQEYISDDNYQINSEITQSAEYSAANNEDSQIFSLTFRKKLLAFKYKQPIFQNFYDLQFKNCYLILNYLTEKSAQNQYIVAHKLEQKWKAAYSKRGTFRLQAERGKPIEDKEDIWKLGRQFVYAWIMSIALGIMELQKMGIFHADIWFKNTVIFGSIFKIIDFDYAFKVRLCQGENEGLPVFRTTVEIIEEWLKTDRNQIIQHLFRHQKDNYQKQSFFNSLKANIRNFSPQQQASQCLNLLNTFSKQSHLKVFSELTLQLISQNSPYERLQNPLTLRQTQGISMALQKLNKDTKFYNQFAVTIQNIKNKITQVFDKTQLLST